MTPKHEMPEEEYKSFSASKKKKRKKTKSGKQTCHSSSKKQSKLTDYIALEAFDTYEQTKSSARKLVFTYDYTPSGSKSDGNEKEVFSVDQDNNKNRKSVRVAYTDYFTDPENEPRKITVKRSKIVSEPSINRHAEDNELLVNRVNQVRSMSVSTNVSHLTSHNRGAVHHGLLDPYHHVQVNNRHTYVNKSLM